MEVISKEEYQITNYLTHEQVEEIAKNFVNLSEYLRAKAFKEIFLVRVLSLEDITNDRVREISFL